MNNNNFETTVNVCLKLLSSKSVSVNTDYGLHWETRFLKVHRKKRKYLVLREKRLELCNEELRLRSITSDEVQELALNVKKVKVDITCLQDIRRALCCREHIESFLRIDGALYALVGILTGRDANKQLEAAACITNLASGSHKSTYKVAKMTGAYLVSFLQGSSHFMQGQCAWAAGNIIMDCEKCYLLLKTQGMLPALLSLLQSPHPDVIESAAFAFHACTKYDDQDISDLSNLTETFSHLFNNQEVHQSAKVDGSLALKNICRRIQEKPDALQLKIGDLVLNYLTKVIQNEHIDVLLATPLVRCVGNLSSGSDVLCMHLLSHVSFKSCMEKIMCSQFHHLKKEFLWALSNLLACHDGSTICFIDLASLLNNILIFLNPLDNAVMQALYLLCILAHQDSKLCQQYINKSFITQVKSLMNCDQPDIAHAAKTFYTLIFSSC